MARGLAAALAAAMAGALFTAAAFVALPSSSSPRAPRVQRWAQVDEASPEIIQAPGAGVAAPEVVQPEGNSFLKWLTAGLAAGVLFAMTAEPAPAWWNTQTGEIGIKAARHLALCKDVKKYHKRFKDSVFKLQKRQKKYPENSVVWTRFKNKIEAKKRREEFLGERFCAKSVGNPLTIANGELVRGSVVVPGLMFLYTAGWIGWAGRSYLIKTRDEMKEILLDVPLALTCMASGFAWPVAAWQDIVDGKLVAKDTDIWRATYWQN